MLCVMEVFLEVCFCIAVAAVATGHAVMQQFGFTLSTTKVQNNWLRVTYSGTIDEFIQVDYKLNSL